MALKLLPEDLSDVPLHLADRYEAQAGRYWDLFYRRNTTKFFKDRHYLHKEFPDLAAGPATLLEVGCGVGNTVFPLQEINPALKIYCCDFAPSAIELVRQNPQYNACGGAIQAFVADITSNMLAGPPAEGGCGVPQGGCDLATMIFVLSAIHPQRMAAAVHNVARCLRTGTGRLLFRDYAEGDLAQERLAGGDRPKRLGPNFYVRGDGTRCYYFSQPEVLALFGSAGFVCDSVTLHERTVVNHKRDISMDRRWLQAVFTLREYRPPAVPLTELLAQPAPSCQHPQQPPAQHYHNALSGSHIAVAAATNSTALGGNGGVQDRAEGQGQDEGAPCSMDVDVDMDTTWPSAVPPHLAGAGVALPRAFDSGSAPGAQQAPVPHTSGNATVTTPALPASPASAAAAAAAAMAPAPSGLYGGSWLMGAAGRLASHLAVGPGQPSGRALLPETLDSADDLRAELSSSPHHTDHHHKRHHQATADFYEPAQQQQQQQWTIRGGSAGGGEDGGGGSGDVDMRVEGGDGGGAGRGGSEAASATAAGASARRRQRSGDVDGGDGGGGGGGGRSLENDLEAEFFATIGRDSAEVVAEEVAATGAALSRVRLVDVAEMAAVRLAATAGAAAAEATSAPTAAAAVAAVAARGAQQPGLGSLATPQPQPPQPREEEVSVSAEVCFRCLLSVPQEPLGTGDVPPATLALARILLASSRLLAGRCALQLGPARAAPSASATATSASTCPLGVAAAAARDAPAAAVLPAMAAVRGSARRVVVSDAGREGLAAAAADLRRNAHLIVIERLRLVTLDWAATAAAAAAASGDGASLHTAATAAAVPGPAGYTYVSGPVRQLRDVLQMQPTGFDLVYAADPLSEITAAAAATAAAAMSTIGAAVAGPAVGADAVVAAARALFEVADRLLTGGGNGGGVGVGGSTGAHVGAPPQACVRQRLLLLCVPGAWAAAHGMGFAALAGVCGWELLVPEQLAEVYGADVSAAAGLGCAALAFRRRLVTSLPY